MKYTTDLREHNGKWYSRIEFTEIDTIPEGCLYTCDTISERKTLYNFNCRSGKVFARDFMSFLGKVYAPVDVPEGYPEGYEVIEHEGTSTIEFKKIRTSREALQDAIDSGVAQAWIDGKELEYSKDNGPWKPYILNTLSNPDFLYGSYRWRIKPKPIIPAKFDWRRIEEYDLSDSTYALLKSDDYYAVFVGYRKANTWFDFDDNIVDPTHFTTFEV